ncbi:hypothetical protein V6N13_106883 [Hibiscus sabdariffa]
MGDSIGFRNLTKYTMANLLISLDLETEQFQEAPKPDCCGSDMCLCHLLVVRGVLDQRVEHRKLHAADIDRQDSRNFSYSGRNFPNLFVRVLCVLRSGEILLEYQRRALLVYDPQCETFKEFTFPEKPARWFKIIIHLGTLNWLEN